MTEPGASNVINQPLTPEQAAARHAELAADPDFGKAAMAGDPVKLAELHRLKRIELGLSPEPGPPATPEQVRQRMLDRDLELDDRRLAAWERLVPMSDEQRLEHRRGLATRQQVEDAKAEIERMKADSGFRLRVLSGDQEARKKWLLAGRVAGMQPIPE